MTNISIEEFYEHKNIKNNKIMIDEIKKFIPTIKYKDNVKTKYHKKKSWKKNKKIWILEKNKNKSPTEIIISQYIDILNKLNENNFPKLTKELVQINITSIQQLQHLVNEILKKALSEPAFSSLYAKLCKYLISSYIEENDQKIFFRELLLNNIQSLFLICIKIETEKDLEQSLFVSGKQMVECVHFIGELYNNNMITSTIINGCFNCLITSIKQKKIYSISLICKLMETVGPLFYKNHKKGENMVFDFLKNIVKKNKDITKKQKFMIYDLYDARKLWL